MKKHTLRIREVDRYVFEALRQGSKTIETRAATSNFRKIRKGDMLNFICGKDKFGKKVKRVSFFKTIDEMVKVIDFKKIMPFASSVAEMENVYYSFPGYREKIQKFGLVALDFY